MKCPKCKTKMVNLLNGFGDKTGIELCDNKNCWFYGIKRHI